MSVTVRPYRRGGWEVDITFRLPDGRKHRERSRAPAQSRTGALRWGQDRERHLLRHGLNKTRKEVPTLETFGPRFTTTTRSRTARSPARSRPSVRS